MPILNRTQRVLVSAVRHLVRPLEYAVVPVQESRPCAWGVLPVSGSFAPVGEHACVGSAKNYFIHDGYQTRLENQYFDDTPSTNESQLEVYLYAKEIADRENLSSVCDIGCGSAYKLLEHFGNLRTIGIDLPKTCAWLRKRYPDRQWLESDFCTTPEVDVDLVIAADVIEHLAEPDQLLAYITRLQPRFVVLSTPDRNLLRNGTHNGPPSNPAHVREWNFSEFEVYIRHHFEVLDHFISSAPQATQCVVCSPLQP